MTPPAKPPRAALEAGRIRFLEAADRVFIREGYDGSTIRAIATEAKTSLARLNRHWSGKEDLFAEVFARHFNPIHEAQHAALTALEAASTDGLVDIRQIIEAFLSPALMAGVGTEERRTSHLVYCRALVDPAPEVKRILTGLTDQIRHQLIDMLRRAMPAPDVQTFFLIVAVVLGAYVHPQLFGENMAAFMGISFESVDWNKAGGVIADLLVDGLRNSAGQPAR